MPARVVTLATSLTGSTNSGSFDWQGGPGTVWIAGTWSSATAKLKSQPFGSTSWIDVTATVTSGGAPVVFATTQDIAFNYNVGPSKLAIYTTGGSTTSSLGVWYVDTFERLPRTND